MGFFIYGGYIIIEFWKKYFYKVFCRCGYGLFVYRNEYLLNNIDCMVDLRLVLMKLIIYIDIICRLKIIWDILNIYILIIFRK